VINLDYDLDYELIMVSLSSDQFVQLCVITFDENLQRICDDFL